LVIFYTPEEVDVDVFEAGYMTPQSEYAEARGGMRQSVMVQNLNFSGGQVKSGGGEVQNAGARRSIKSP